MGRFIGLLASVAGAFVLLLNSRESAAQSNDAAILHTKIVKTIAAAGGVTTEFSTVVDKLAMMGVVKVKRGNKFILMLPKRTIYCNGSTVWNYSPETKSVIVGKYDGSQRQLNFEIMFFTVLEKYIPAGLTRKLQSGGQRYDVLKLLPASPDNLTENITAVEVYCKPNTDVILKIAVRFGGQTTVYSLKNLKFTSAIKDAEFDFNPPKDVEMVDMR